LGIASLSAELREKRRRGAIEHLNQERISRIKIEEPEGVERKKKRKRRNEKKR